MSATPRTTLAGVALAAASALVLAGCASGAEQAEPAPSSSTTTVQTNNGDVTVPVQPVRVAVLDSTAFATVKKLGITPVVAPKPLLPESDYADWIADPDIADAGSHREPNLEIVNEAEPDLIIGGYRFSDYTDDLSKIATTIDIAPSEDADGGYIEGLKTQTATLGQIFDKKDETDQIIAALTDAIDSAAENTGTQSVFLAVSSGGTIDNGAGRIGRLLEPLQLTDVFADEDLDETSVHNDSGLAPETVAQANPDWLILLDRDAAVGGDGEVTPGSQLVDAQEAWENTTFQSKNQKVFLASDFYLTEGIQAYTDAYTDIADAFERAS